MTALKMEEQFFDDNSVPNIYFDGVEHAEVIGGVLRFTTFIRRYSPESRTYERCASGILIRPACATANVMRVLQDAIRRNDIKIGKMQ